MSSTAESLHENRAPSVWERLGAALLFSDMTELIKRVRAMEGRGERVASKDLVTLGEVDRLLGLPSRFPEYGAGALRSLRSSVSVTIQKGESGLFWSMGVIHFWDVLISMFGALCSMTILRVFEEPSPQWMGAGTHVLGGPVSLAVLVAVGLALAVFALNTLSTAMHSWKIDREMLLSYRIRSGLMRHIFSHALELSPVERQRVATGDMVNLAAQDAKHMAFFYSHAFVDYFVLGSCSLILLLVMLFLFGPAALAGFAVLLLQIPVMLLFARLNEKRNKALMERADTRLSLATEWIQGMRIVRYFGWGRAFLEKVLHLSHAEFGELKRVHTQFSVAFAISLGWWMLVALATLAAMTLSGEPVSVSAAFGVFWLSARLGTLLNPVPWFVSIHALSRVSEKRLHEFFCRQTMAEDLGTGLVMGASDRHPEQAERDGRKAEVLGIGFRIRGLVIRFGENERPVLEIGELDIEAEESVAILGEVGAGKTVLLNVLMGELRPTAGFVELVIHEPTEEGARIRTLNLHSEEGIRFVQGHLSFVPQQSVVLSATVKENVPFLPGRPPGMTFSPLDLDRDLSDKAIVAALEKADLEQDLRSFPQGLDTLIGEKGINLSGGQKQRLSMSRAHYLENRIVVFDDPLSALDRDTEAKLVERLFEERESCLKAGHCPATLLLSTHRLACVPRCDRVLLLSEGRVICSGDPRELLKGDSLLMRWMERHGES